MISMLSVIICLVVLVVVVHTRKPQMDLIEISKQIDKLKANNTNLVKSFQVVCRTNNELRRKYDEICTINNTLITQINNMNDRITALELDNKRIKAALENHKLISTAAVVKPFKIKLVK